MKINIDFDELLNKSVNASIDASVNFTDRNRDSDSVSKHLQLISTVAAETTISILRNYHSALEEALTCVFDTTPTSH